MQIIQVIPGADRAQLEETARHCGMTIGIQGSMQIVFAESSNMGAGTPNNSNRNASSLSSAPISENSTKED